MQLQKVATDHSFLLIGANAAGIQVLPNERPPDDLIAWVQLHDERLRALLDRPVVLHVGWTDGDDAATVTVSAEEGAADPTRLFEKFTLAFPKRQR